MTLIAEQLAELICDHPYPGGVPLMVLRATTPLSRLAAARCVMAAIALLRASEREVRLDGGAVQSTGRWATVGSESGPVFMAVFDSAACSGVAEFFLADRFCRAMLPTLQGQAN